jgi:hypothetical protein
METSQRFKLADIFHNAADYKADDGSEQYVVVLMSDDEFVFELDRNSFEIIKYLESCAQKSSYPSREEIQSSTFNALNLDSHDKELISGFNETIDYLLENEILSLQT